MRDTLETTNESHLRIATIAICCTFFLVACSQVDDEPSQCIPLLGQKNICSAQFVDVGYFLHSTANSGESLQSFRWGLDTPERKDRQTYFIGNQNVPAGNIERRAFFVFDVAAPSQLTEARLLLWVWPPLAINGNTGSYLSSDNSETMTLYTVDNFTPEEVLAVPLNDNLEHSLDVPIFNDLGDGAILGEREFSIEDRSITGLIPSPTASETVNCLLPKQPCGKWVEIPIPETALRQLSQTKGRWIFGAAVSTIGPNIGSREWLHGGTLVDLHQASGETQAFATPAPKLIFEYEQ